MSFIGSFRAALFCVAALPLSAFIGCSEEAPPTERSEGQAAVAPAALPAHRPAWEEPPPPIREAPIVPADRLHRATLDNGLHVIVLEDHGLPQLALGLRVRRGAGIVEPARAGLASFTSEVMRRGAGERDALALARSIDEIGAELAVSSGWDSIGVLLTGLSRDRDRLQDVLADVALRPRFEQGEAERARAEQLASIQQAMDDPGTVVRWGAASALYAGHRYGLPRQGTPDSVAQLDAAAARGFHAKLFVPNNAVLFASGDLDAAAFLADAERLFGADVWPQGVVPAPAAPPEAPVSTGDRVVLVVDREDLGQARIVIAHEGIERTDDRRIAAALMNNVLGGSGFSSRLMKRIRSDEGLTYGVGSRFSLRRHPGPFAVSTFTRVPETRRTVDLILAEIAKIRSDAPPTELELANAASYAVGHFALGLETPAALLASLVNLDIYGLPGDSLDTYRTRVKGVTVEDVSTLATTLLHPDRAVVVVHGPAADLVPQLEDLGTVTVVTAADLVQLEPEAD